MANISIERGGSDSELGEMECKFLTSQPIHMLCVVKKNCLSKTVLLSTQNICLKIWKIVRI